MDKPKKKINKRTDFEYGYSVQTSLYNDGYNQACDDWEEYLEYLSQEIMKKSIDQ